MVSVLVFYSYDLSSNPAGVLSYVFKTLFENGENKPKKAGVCPFLNR